MNAWPTARNAGSVLSGAEGELVSVSIVVEPRLLERLLDVLAGLDFPINPQLYHQAALVYVYADGREQVQPVTMVEFPAYAGRLHEIRQALEGLGLDPQALAYKHVLEGIRSDFDVKPAPPGAPYAMVLRYRHAPEHLRRSPSH